ncbi:MAG: hypothetical protein RL094_226 [Candidatus Parcubacteria bacterium]|jgi:hypothetical protein
MSTKAVQFFLVFVFVLFFLPVSVQAANIKVQLDVFVCNNNLICEDVIGENYGSCPSDCEAPTSTPTTTPSSTPPATTNTSTNFGQYAYSSGGITGQNQKPNSTSTITNDIVGAIAVSPLTDSAVVSWNSKLPSLMTFSWGKTAQYEIGSIAESWYHTAFKVNLDSLDPGRQYYYKITLKDTLGVEKTVEGTFMTLPIENKAPVPPDSFKATINGSGIVFEWNNPDDANFSYVRLVRSTNGYPKDTLDGKVVYEGRGTYSRDINIENKKGYYYSLFAVDKNDRASSPAILYIDYDKFAFERRTATTTGTYDPLLRNDDPYISTVYPLTNDTYKLCGSMSGVIKNRLAGGAVSDPLPLGDVAFFQNGSKIDRNPDEKVAILNGPVLIRIKSTLVPFNERSAMAFCVSGGVEEVQKAYLFSYNTKSGYFEVIIPAFSHFIDYDFYVGMLKYGVEEQILSRGEFALQNGVSPSIQFAALTVIKTLIHNVLSDERFVFLLLLLSFIIATRILINVFKT